MRAADTAGLDGGHEDEEGEGGDKQAKVNFAGTYDETSYYLCKFWLKQVVYLDA